MQKRTMLIYNPNSGKSGIKQSLSEVIEILSKDNSVVTVFPTKHRNHATELIVKNADNVDLIVCCGGDGTLNEVINGMISLQNPPPLGYIPSGTVNDCAEIIMQGNLFAFDVGKLNERAFSYFAGFGAFTDVSHNTPQSAKRTLGKTAYLLEGIKRIGCVPSCELNIIADNKTINGDFIFGMISNSVSVAGFKKPNSKNIKLDDGFFELTLAHKPKNNADKQALFQCIIKGINNPKYLHKINASKITVTSEEFINWNIDGEYAGKYTNAVVNNYKQALNIITN